MAVEYFDRVANLTDSEKDQFHFEKSITLSTPGNSPWIMVPSGIQGISLTLEIIDGAGAVEITNDLDTTIRNGVSIVKQWPLGIVSGTVEDFCRPPKAIRVVNYSGTTRLMMGAQ